MLSLSLQQNFAMDSTGYSCGSNWVRASSVIGTAFSASALAPGVMRPWVMSLAMGSACSSTCCVAFCRGNANRSAVIAQAFIAESQVQMPQ